MDNVHPFKQKGKMAESETSIPVRLRLLRQRTGLSMDKVAKAVGLAGASSYQRYEDESLFKSRYLPIELTEKLVELFCDRGEPPITVPEVLALSGLRFGRSGLFLGADPEQVDAMRHPKLRSWIQRARGADGSHPPPDVWADPPSTSGGPWPRNIPIVGTRSGDEDGMFIIHDATVEYAPRPPTISDLANVRAFFVVDETMAPWRKRGDLVYVRPRISRPGDHVVVEMKALEGSRPPAYLKKLIRRDGTSLQLGQYNPLDDTLIVDMTAVKTLWNVLEWDELLGL